MRFIGVFNRGGGTFRQTDMDTFMAMARDIFAEAGHELETRAVDGAQLIAELERAVSDPSADVVLAGGGDGTISAAAAVCFKAGKPLAVLPLDGLVAAKEVAGSALNDTFLALGGGGIRRYLDRLGQLPDSSLVASVPLPVPTEAGAAGTSGSVRTTSSSVVT